MQDVADDHQLQTGQVAEVAAYREQVEERLRRVRVPPVAGIDDPRCDVLAHQVGRAGGPMSDDDHIGAQGLQGPRRVYERFAFVYARSRGRHVDNVGAQVLGC